MQDCSIKVIFPWIIICNYANTNYINLFSSIMIHAKASTSDLKARISEEFCSMLRDRIIRLKGYGLFGVWMKSDWNDAYNAGSILGYLDDDWQAIVK